jgi:hypothetical protein
MLVYRSARSLRAAALALIAAAALAPECRAIETMSFATDRLAGKGWHAESVSLEVHLADDGLPAATLRIGTLVLPSPVGALHGLRVDCAALLIAANSQRCREATIRLEDARLDDRPFHAAFHYERLQGRFTFEVPDLPWSGLSLSVAGRWERGTLATATVETGTHAFTEVYAPVQALLPWLPPLEADGGELRVTLTWQDDDRNDPALSAAARFTGVSVTAADGAAATGGLAGRGNLRLHRGGDPGVYRFAADVALETGEVYVEPVYADLADGAITVHARGDYGARHRHLRFTALEYEHAQHVSATFEGALVLRDGVTVERGVLSLGAVQLPASYGSYLQGFLVGTPLARLETRGVVSGRLQLAAGRLAAAELDLQSLAGDDRDGRLAVYGATGSLAWRRRSEPSDSAQGADQDCDGDGAAQASELTWQGGFLYGFDFGAGAARFCLAGDDIALLDTLSLPLLDGSLVVSTLRAAGISGDNPAVDFEAALEPVGMRRLTDAVGWPSFPGTLSGELPRLTLRDGVMTIGGSLVARVFDGTVRLDDVRVEEPFGANRRSTADVVLEGLDLALVTDAFPLGHVEGRLDGRIEGLELVRGNAVAFDASFYTPPGDRSRHRISRRAISNLTEIAGAGTALLSRGFLSFFREFRYDELGISCRLEGDVCRMGGVGARENGYFLVRGAGLPRINVVGYEREVNWPRLLEQIREALRSRGATTADPAPPPDRPPVNASPGAGSKPDEPAAREANGSP